MKGVKRIELSLPAAKAISKLNRTFLGKCIEGDFKQPRPFPFRILKGK